jgi:hypothetical protein
MPFAPARRNITSAAHSPRRCRAGRSGGWRHAASSQNSPSGSDVSRWQRPGRSRAGGSHTRSRRSDGGRDWVLQGGVGGPPTRGGGGEPDRGAGCSPTRRDKRSKQAGMGGYGDELAPTYGSVGRFTHHRGDGPSPGRRRLAVAAGGPRVGKTARRSMHQKIHKRYIFCARRARSPPISIPHFPSPRLSMTPINFHNHDSAPEDALWRGRSAIRHDVDEPSNVQSRRRDSLSVP